jgi:sterol desaturase/sphingolipid hydroxylase (fatty acid hydroxylase superfamily)
MMTGVAVWLTLSRDLERNAVIGLIAAVTVAIAFAVERINPLLDRWRMTKDSFVRRDLPFIGLGFVVEQAATIGVSLVAAATVTTGGFGPLAGLPLPVQAVVALLALDLLWYAYHRAAHTFARLWRVHGVHHSPSQLYVLMHPVFHPLDLLVSRFAISLIVFKLSGLRPDAAFIALAVLGLQTTVSHINTDLRTGWLNYLLVGTETPPLPPRRRGTSQLHLSPAGVGHPVRHLRVQPEARTGPARPRRPDLLPRSPRIPRHPRLAVPRPGHPTPWGDVQLTIAGAGKRPLAVPTSPFDPHAVTGRGHAGELA